jgi:type VI secretion system protein ImpM
MSYHAMTAWLFGKLPTHGDFIFRGLSMQQRDQLDTWLSQEMESARLRLGPEFEDSYDSAPPWCFTASEIDGLWEGGALCPSMDSAGRRFPILVACNGLPAEQAVNAAQSCVDAIYNAFEEAMTADGLCDAVSGLCLKSADEDVGTSWWVEGEEHETLIRLDGKFPVGLISTMLEGATQ